MPELPAELALAFSEAGRPTPEQVQQLMEIEASSLGMTLTTALEALSNGSLPRTPVGLDFRYLADELRAA